MQSTTAPETVTNFSQMRKRIRHEGNRWAQQRCDQFICTRDTGPGILIRKLFENRSNDGRRRKRQGFNDAKTEFFKW